MSVTDDLDIFELLDASSLPLRQQRILVAIRDWVVRYGYAPSTREIGDAVGLRSASSVSKHLASLEEKGFLRRGATMARPIASKLGYTCTVNHRFPSGPTVMRSGEWKSLGMTKCVSCPAGVMRRIAGETAGSPAVTHTLPSGPAVIPRGAKSAT